MRLVWAILVMVLLTSPVAGKDNPDSIDLALKRIHDEYVAMASKPEIHRLVRLDQELRYLVPYYGWQCGGAVESERLKPEYEAIGLRPMLYESDFMIYSGKLLVEAHSLDPDSEYRSYTLYSNIFPAGNEAMGDAPSEETAKSYLFEYPDGPFVVNATMALAHLYDDLYKVLRMSVNAGKLTGRYSCYDVDIHESELVAERNRFQFAGTIYYRELVRLLPTYPRAVENLAELEKGESRGWFYCGD